MEPRAAVRSECLLAPEQTLRAINYSSEEQQCGGRMLTVLSSMQNTYRVKSKPKPVGLLPNVPAEIQEKHLRLKLQCKLNTK